MTITETPVEVVLEVGCDGSPACEKIADDLWKTLGASGRYRECSVMPLPRSLDEWLAEHRTARKRTNRCRARGYVFAPLARELHVDEIHAINVSATHRQGRAMSPAYLQRPTFSPLPVFHCARHAIRTFGVWSDDGTLFAYLTTYRAGDLILVSQILGHADRLRDEIMYLLFAGMIESESRVQPGTVVYNRHDSGGPGLVFYKERVGLGERDVEWRR